MLIYEWFHYSLSPSLFVAFTYKEAPAFFGTAFSFFLLFSFLGLSFCHLPNNLSNYNVLTENAPFIYQISGIWSNHEGSLLSWCRILSFYKLLLFFRNLPKRQNVSRRRIHIEVLFLCLELRKEFHYNYICPSLRKRKEGKGVLYNFTQFCTPFLLKKTCLDYEPRGKSTFDRPAIFYSPLYSEIKKEPLGYIGSPWFLEEKKTYPLLHLARNKKEKERYLYIDEQQIKGVLGISFFFYLFLSASSDPFVRTFFVCTEQLAELNPLYMGSHTLSSSLSFDSRGLGMD